MNHVVLLGDSIFDNESYVNGGLTVIDHLKNLLSPSWKATLLAKDGSTTREVVDQLQRLPSDATHIIVSAGGNDAMSQIPILLEEIHTMADALQRLSTISQDFEQDYQRMLAAILERHKKVGLCTIYYPAFPDNNLQRMSVAALTFFNDPIIRAAATNGLPIIDLRMVCNKPQDYANPIEPSVSGGLKIAKAIHKMLFEYDFSNGKSVLMH